MAEIRGIVVKKQGERAEVKVDKAESELTGLPKYIDCWNPVGAKAGDVLVRNTAILTNARLSWLFTVCR